ncbi:DUF2919 family protein [Rheinheimera baltica]|uniref:DUF2919 family protein n=1 Tax=Rheinheimera baltica TaxID=67576 RepID=A0ABT9HXY0_9GAMM|nr:DUF2919 family protein [Rheinheimera baltica]MDP5135660.1 DUF2919 family protein [Rheinheimera baltica]MDP5141435.1 DUF2919 family protein [Rheinheimera baltica]
MSKAPLWPVLDDYGLHKVPLRFYWLLLLLLRPYISWILVLTLPQDQRSMLALFYPLQRDFIIACAVAAPLLLLIAALSQRKPKGRRGWRHIWRYGGLIMLSVAVVDLVVSVSHLPSQVMLDAPWRIVSPLLLIIGCIWLLRSRTLKAVFAEWPEPIAPVTETNTN